MRKEDKAIIIEKLGEKLKEYAHFYLVDVTGLNAETTSALRRKCFKSEIKMVVVKNNLLHKALEQSGTDFTPLYDSLKGTTAVFFCNTANVPAKLIKEEGKATGIPALKAAYAEEEIYVGAENLDALVAIKSKNEVIAEVVALLQSPAKNVISALQSGSQTIHGVLKTLGERSE
ncbi:50S ribosomal protein L10 [uncultured Alloprevotella sp.]|uniref:50S ribosomal protein L10 n=1 Tax=uncultured Alloprevotella sp. TaxID=1283315 RepID=UPI00325FB72B